MPKKILNAEDVDFVYIENITFGVVMKDDKVKYKWILFLVSKLLTMYWLIFNKVSR